MKSNLLVYDVGSTYTKATAFFLEGDDLSFVGRAQAPTSLTHVQGGLDAACAALEKRGVRFTSDVSRYSTCSAAGGLRMVAVGFMPRVTGKAAKEVAMNAGARVLEVLSRDDNPEYRLQVLKEIRPDIILLAGGTDGGDTASAEENAESLSAPPSRPSSSSRAIKKLS
jgi:uncharacterized protein (TIGR01319 family)